MSLVPGACALQKATCSADSASPPMMNARALPSASSGASCSPRIRRCVGVNLTRLYPHPARSADASPSTFSSSSTSSAVRPESSGAHRLVTVRSKESGDCTGAPLPSSTRYAPMHQLR